MAKRIPPYTQMTLKDLRKKGLPSEVVEKWISRTTGQPDWENATDGEGGKKKAVRGFRKDFLNFIDIIALDDVFTYGVQCTSGKQRSAHLTKIINEPNAKLWLACPSRKIWLVTWSKLLVKPGGKARRWRSTYTEITRADLGLPVQPEAPF